MGLTSDHGRYYFVLNVPKHLFGKVLGRSGQPMRQIRLALRTADLSVARRKAIELEELKRAEWHLLEVGETALAHDKLEAAKVAAESRGFDYVPSHVLLQRSFRENGPLLTLRPLCQNSLSMALKKSPGGCSGVSRLVVQADRGG